jgi:plastocyanin
MHIKAFLTLCAAIALGLAASSCGGDSSSTTPSSPSPTPTTMDPMDTTTPVQTTGTTITINLSGVSPRSVTVAAGSRVTFVNSATAPSMT